MSKVIITEPEKNIEHTPSRGDYYRYGEGLTSLDIYKVIIIDNMFSLVDLKGTLWDSPSEGELTIPEEMTLIPKGSTITFTT